jgi:N-acetylated-alpha-linked acidic dipeptidase
VETGEENVGLMIEIPLHISHADKVSRILASWDNEEYGLVGSTEWGEENADWLSKHCVACEKLNEENPVLH